MEQGCEFVIIDENSGETKSSNETNIDSMIVHGSVGFTIIYCKLNPDATDASIKINI